MTLDVQGSQTPWVIPEELSPRLVSPFSFKCHLFSSLLLGPLTCSHACVLSSFSCVQLCEPVDCGSPGPSVHGILQAGVGCHAFFQGYLPDSGTEPASLMPPALAGVTWEAQFAIHHLL